MRKTTQDGRRFLGFRALLICALIAGAVSAAPKQKPKPLSIEEQIRVLRQKLAAVQNKVTVSKLSTAELDRLRNMFQKAPSDVLEQMVDVELKARTPPLTPEQMYAREVKHVVTVTSSINEGNTSVGTGFMYPNFPEEPHIVTNFHVVNGATRISIRTQTKQELQVSGIVWADKDLDLAVLAAPLPITQTTCELTSNWTDDPVAIGETVYVIGNPRGLESSFTNGIVSGVRKGKGFSRLYQITAPISPGSSGSPVFNKSGKVIGIVRSFLKDSQNLNFCVPSELIEHPTGVTMSLEEWARFSRSEEGSLFLPPVEESRARRLEAPDAQFRGIDAFKIRPFAELNSPISRDEIQRLGAEVAAGQGLGERLVAGDTPPAGLSPVELARWLGSARVTIEIISTQPTAIMWEIRVTRNCFLADEREVTPQQKVFDSGLTPAAIFADGGLVTGEPEKAKSGAINSIRRSLTGICAKLKSASDIPPATQ